MTLVPLISGPDSTFGSWCLFCGDYYHGMTRFDAMLTGTRGCQRCVREGAYVAVSIERSEPIMFDGIIFDCEIERGVLAKKAEPELGIRYATGWKDYRGMGVAVVGVYDYLEGMSRVFCKDNLSELRTLIQSRRWVIGFNSRNFDEPLLAANSITIPTLKSYDILVEVWKAAGLGPEFVPHTHRGYGLAALCKANFNLAKSGDGAQAPTLWQQGKIGTVIDYCLHDVWLTKRLMDRILSEGVLNNPRSLGDLEIKRPEVGKWAGHI